MPSLIRDVVVIAFLAPLGLVVAAGCENTAGDCKLTADCTGGLGTTTATVTTTEITSCDPAEWDGAAVDSCGVFVSASATDDGDGTSARPFKTLAQAVGTASTESTPRIYACAETFNEVVVLPVGVSLYGGLDCTDGWKHKDEGRTTIAPDSPEVALSFNAKDPIFVQGFKVMAKDAAAPSASSIAAAAADGATIELVRCELWAGNGADGEDAMAEATPAGDGPGGNAGAKACMTGMGGAPVSHDCGAEGAEGGRGGNGGTDAEINGGAGSPGVGVGAGTGGLGQTSADACVNGEPGMPGTAGNPSPMAAPAAPSFDTEKRGANGFNGRDGRAGSGGGGGGGGQLCSGGGNGGGGGGGGGGGCGGKGGKGGTAGGHSIALWAAGAKVTLTSVTLTARNGGKGGKGADGQPGGMGGPGGAGGVKLNGSQPCPGGAGGVGGAGGPGGGGEGGSSIAAVWQKAAPAVDDTTALVPGTAGSGGLAGMLPVPGKDGNDGKACAGFELEMSDCQAP